MAADELDDPDTAIVAFANCPFAEFAATHPELVCGLHRGLVAGFVAAMGDAVMVEFCPLFHRTPCQVSIGPVDGGAPRETPQRPTRTGAGLAFRW